MKRLLIIPVLCLCQLLSAQVFQVDTILLSGDVDNRINLVILGDGYQESEFDQFETDANSFADVLFLETPYKEYKSYFNVFSIKVPSNESGASHPGTATDVTEPSHAVSTVDNYFGSTFDAYDIHRLLVPDNSFAINTVLALNFPAYDQVFVLVNTPHYGGSGGQYATASLDFDANEIAIHEAGHSFANLKDEYYAGDVYAGEGINMTSETDPANVKWKNWMNTDGIGIYQHCCSGNSSNWYRPHQNCKMRALYNPFCAVCIEGTIETIHSLTSPIVSYTPSDNLVSIGADPLEFTLDLIKPNPNTLKVDWVFNGSNVGSNIDTLLIDPNDLVSDVNNLTVYLQDTTAFLRIDDHESIHLYMVSWAIENSTATENQVSSTMDQIRIELFPNPATDYINVKLSSEIVSDLKMELVDLNGKQLTPFKTMTDSEMSINLSEFPVGIYIMNFYLQDVLIASKKVARN